MNVKFDFNTPPADNVAFMVAKKPELHFDYDEIKFESHQRAFTVAKVTQIELLAEIQESLENAFVEGQSYQTWLKNLKPTLEKRGWLGATSVTNPKTCETKDIFVGARRLKTIFYTNARTAYAQSEARAGYELPLSQYIRYVAIMDNRVRPEHAALHGKIAHRDDKFWATNYPPNGWNCRCAVEFVSKDEMDAHGWAEMSDIEKRLNFAEDDWAYDTRNLVKGDEDLQNVLKNKIESLAKNASATAALEMLRKQLNAGRESWEVVKELKKAKNQKVLSLCEVPRDLGEFLGNGAKSFEMGANELKAHLNKHKEVSAFDYALAPYFLNSDSLEVWQDETPKNPAKFLAVSKFGMWYMMSFKNLQDEKRLFFENLIHSNSKENLTKNKKKIWSRK